MTATEIARLVRARRRALDLTHEVVAATVGCHPVTISRLEHEPESAKLGTLIRVLEILGLALEVT